jgi:hypothetical protein
MVIARVDAAGSVTWLENGSRLLPLLSALRLLRSLLGRCLLTFRHCALQVRDGAIEKVPSRIDVHGIPITPERKKQRLRLTKRVLARVVASADLCETRCVKAERDDDETMQCVVARLNRRCAI